MTECPDCRTQIAEGRTTCPGCGLDVSAPTAICESCRETIAADADACPACGHLRVSARCDRHPDRDATGQCALCGTVLCADCEAGDRNYHRCEDHAEVRILEGWAEVLSLPDEVEARLIEDNLRAEGIDARLLSQKDHSAFPVEFGDLARVRLLVPTYAFGDANRIIVAHRDAAGEVSFGCPNCGEPFDENQRVCGACGEALV